MPAGRPSVRRPAAPVAGNLDLVERALHAAVRKAGPHLRVEMRWGLPWYRGQEMVVCVVRFSHHVGLEFWRGRSLVEAGCPLEGTGKNLRHLKFRTVTEARSSATARALKLAVRWDTTSSKPAR